MSSMSVNFRLQFAVVTFISSMKFISSTKSDVMMTHNPALAREFLLQDWTCSPPRGSNLQAGFVVDS